LPAAPPSGPAAQCRGLHQAAVGRRRRARCRPSGAAWRGFVRRWGRLYGRGWAGLGVRQRSGLAVGAEAPRVVPASPPRWRPGLAPGHCPAPPAAHSGAPLRPGPGWPCHLARCPAAQPATRAAATPAAHTVAAACCLPGAKTKRGASRATAGLARRRMVKGARSTLSHPTAYRSAAAALAGRGHQRGTSKAQAGNKQGSGLICGCPALGPPTLRRLRTLQSTGPP
jgi:hypothetical protein